MRRYARDFGVFPDAERAAQATRQELVSACQWHFDEGHCVDSDHDEETIVREFIAELAKLGSGKQSPL